MEIYVSCPNCSLPILIMKKDINCAIFRHGIFKKNHKQMDPHTSREICTFLAKNNYIFGCGKPFKLVRKNDVDYSTEKCDYI